MVQKRPKSILHFTTPAKWGQNQNITQQITHQPQFQNYNITYKYAILDNLFQTFHGCTTVRAADLAIRTSRSHPDLDMSIPAGSEDRLLREYESRKRFRVDSVSHQRSEFRNILCAGSWLEGSHRDHIVPVRWLCPAVRWWPARWTPKWDHKLIHH